MTEVLVFATPVALAALGETITQKSGVINIGLEGTMLVAAFFAMLATYATGNPWVGLAAGAVAGCVLTAIFGFFVITLATDQVVTGTAINLLALGVTGVLFRTRFGQSGKLLEVPRLPKVMGVDPVVILAILLALALGWVLARTAWGLLVRATGEYPAATEAAGFSVASIRYQALMMGGLLGGLAGSHLALGVNGSFTENTTAGRGFVAIAMVAFGRWKPIYVLLASLLIGYLDSLQYEFQARGIQFPPQLLLALPYAVALFVLVVVGRGTLAPTALGKPYNKL